MSDVGDALLDAELDNELDDLLDEGIEDEGYELEDMLKYDDVKEVAKVLRSEKMHQLLTDIEEMNANEGQGRAATRAALTVGSPAYALLLESNKMAQDIDRDIVRVHKFVKDHYAVRFPELETFIFDPVSYAKVVSCIGNQLDVTNLSKKTLSDLLPAHTIMVIQTTGSTTAGRPLTEAELETVTEACDELLALDEAKQLILEFVQSKMSLLAPNTSAIVGTAIASQLIGAAGGLSALSKLSSNVIRTLGKSRKTLSGFGASQLHHAGFILNTDLVSQQPANWKRKTAALVANKVTLAIRSDCDLSVTDGKYGEKLREEIQKKIAQWKEPPPAKLNKALPAPRDAPKRKRAGAKVQRMKAKWKQTTVSKHMNRITFGQVEEEDFYEGRSYGNLKKDMGKVNIQAETKVKAKKPKLDPKQLKPQGLQSGLASSLAFTPVQGMELGTMDLVPEQKETSKYFGSSAAFQGTASIAGNASFLGSTVVPSTVASGVQKPK